MMTVLVMLMLPLGAVADDFTVDGVHYSMLSEALTVEVIAPSSGKYTGDIIIPESVIYNDEPYQVLAIGDNAFKGAKGVTSVTLPLVGITSIGKYAFNDCTGLTEFALPASITSIGNNAFFYCDNLKHLYVHSEDPTSYHSGSSAFSKIHYGEHTCTLHVPTGCKDVYAADATFSVFTQVEEFDPPQAYDLVIAGKRVTSLNASDILGDGAASYDASTNTLTVSDDIIATGPYHEGAGVISSIPNLTVQVSEPATITARECGIFLVNSAIITGASLLTITNNTTNGIALEIVKGDVTINAANLSLTGQLKCGSQGILTVNSSTIAISTTSAEGAIYGWGDLMLNGCYLDAPEEGVYDTSDKRVENTDGNAAQTVKIVPGSKVYYDLYVAGTQANYKNASDILGNGVASYDASTNTLTISGYITATGSNLEGTGIYSSIPDLTVQVSAPATITAKDYGIHIKNSASIAGTSLLTITNNTKNGIALLADKADLTVNAANLSLTGQLKSSTQGKLTVNSSAIAISTTSDEGALCGWDDLALNGCYIGTPENGEYDASDRRVEDPYGDAAKTVSIKPGTAPIYYDLYVRGTHVNNNNASDILGNGVASYDASTKTLTISGDITATGSGLESGGIISNINNLTILVSATSTITASEVGLYLSESATITGTSLLTVNCTNDVAIGAFETSISIKNANLSLNGKVTSAQGSLTIQSSHIAISTSSSSGAISNWEALQLTDCQIKTPEQGVFDVSDKRVEDKNGDAATTVQIVYMGDVNKDIKVDQQDVTLMADYILGLKPKNFFEDAADMNGDKKVDAADLVLLIKMMK
jgi:hypothetical protein